MKHHRRRTPSNEIEEALVEAAFHLLEAEGPEALTVRRVAAEAGVAPMGVYNHFEGGKNGVVDALFRVGFEILTGELDEVVSVDDPVEALRAGLHQYRRLALDHPRCYEVMFLCAVPGFVPSDRSHQVADEAFEVLVQGIVRGMRRGVFREGDGREVAQQVWSAVHGAVALEIAGIHMVDDMEQSYTELVELILRGMSVPPGEPPADTRSRSGAVARSAAAPSPADATTSVTPGRSGSRARGGRPARAR